jgi:hypothetical protein
VSSTPYFDEAARSAAFERDGQFNIIGVRAFITSCASIADWMDDLYMLLGERFIDARLYLSARPRGKTHRRRVAGRIPRPRRTQSQRAILHRVLCRYRLGTNRVSTGLCQKDRASRCAKFISRARIFHQVHCPRPQCDDGSKIGHYALRAVWRVPRRAGFELFRRGNRNDRKRMCRDGTSRVRLSRLARTLFAANAAHAKQRMSK